MDAEKLKVATVKGFLWRLLENIGTQFVSFIIQIVLARIILPEAYGIIAIVSVFISISSVFIQTGFSSALIQKKEISELEYSSVFYAGLALGAILYIILYFAAPFIADYYSEQLLVPILRIQSFVLLFSALSSVHSAIIVRNLQFRKSFIKGLIATVIHGFVGISMALSGYGVWALVFSNLVHYFISAIILWLIVKWRPQAVFSFSALKDLFSFSSKLLLVSLMNSFFVSFKSLYIGKKFDTTTLAYYNRGFQIPSLIMINTDGAMNAVLFPALAKCQSDMERLVNGLRRSLKTSFFVVLPMMVGLIIVAKPLIIILLTERWLQAVPFMQLVCLICITWPFSAKNQAYNAIGRSDVTLKLNIVEKIFEMVLLLSTVRFGVYVMVFSGFISGMLPVIIGFFTNRKILGYTIKQQFEDILPTLFLTLFMAIPTYCIGLLIDNYWLLLTTQIIAGVTIYIGGAMIFKNEIFYYIINLVRYKVLENKL